MKIGVTTMAYGGEEDDDDETTLIPSTPTSTSTASFVSFRSGHVRSETTFPSSPYFSPASPSRAVRDELGNVGGDKGVETRGSMLCDDTDEGANRVVYARGDVVGGIERSPWFEACGVVLVETGSVGGGGMVGREVVFV